MGDFKLNFFNFIYFVVGISQEESLKSFVMSVNVCLVSTLREKALAVSNLVVTVVG